MAQLAIDSASLATQTSPTKLPRSKSPNLNHPNQMTTLKLSPPNHAHLNQTKPNPPPQHPLTFTLEALAQRAAACLGRPVVSPVWWPWWGMPSMDRLFFWEVLAVDVSDSFPLCPSPSPVSLLDTGGGYRGALSPSSEIILKL